jgi:hypothetical protein
MRHVPRQGQPTRRAGARRSRPRLALGAAEHGLGEPGRPRAVPRACGLGEERQPRHRGAGRTLDHRPAGAMGPGSGPRAHAAATEPAGLSCCGSAMDIVRCALPRAELGCATRVNGLRGVFSSHAGGVYTGRCDGALCRFVWNATLTVWPGGDHLSPRPSRQREGGESPSAVRVAGQKSLGRQPFGERCTGRGRVKAKPYGWPAASLDPAATRRTASPQPREAIVAFHTKRRGTCDGDSTTFPFLVSECANRNWPLWVASLWPSCPCS